MGLSANELDVVFVLVFGPPCLATRFFTAIFDCATMPFCVVKMMKLVDSRFQSEDRFLFSKDSALVEAPLQVKTPGYYFKPKSPWYQSKNPANKMEI